MVHPMEMPSEEMGSGKLEREVALLKEARSLGFDSQMDDSGPPASITIKPSPVFQATGEAGSMQKKQQTSPLLFKEKNLFSYFLRERN